jgi:hypothetical protein
VNPDPGAIAGGVVRDEALRASLRLVGQQVMDFVTRADAAPMGTPPVVVSAREPFPR